VFARIDDISAAPVQTIGSHNCKGSFVAPGGVGDRAVVRGTIAEDFGRLCYHEAGHSREGGEERKEQRKGGCQVRSSKSAFTSRLNRSCLVSGISL
jgi:hypothetical protein